MTGRESVLEIFGYFHVEVFNSQKPVSSSRHLLKAAIQTPHLVIFISKEKSVTRLKNPKTEIVFFSVLTAVAGVSETEAGSPLGGRGSSSWSAGSSVM